jgi:FixJ family two-component response regulator
MPEAEEKIKQEETVDIDTSGPDVEVQLPEEKKEEPVVEQTIEKEIDKTYENERETKLEDGGSAGDSSEKPVEQSSVQENNQQKSESKEAEEYSEGVKKRIAKLTKKMREAERQREEALRYAESVKKERDEFKTQANTLDKDYTTEMENRISGQLAAAQAKLTAARQAEDPKAETEALTAISQLGYEQGRLAELKTQNEMRDKAAKEEPVKQPTRQPAAPPDPKAEAWASNNEWFGTDSAMTYTAFDLHRKLTEEEGIDPKSDEYYKEIDKRIRLEFPHKFDKPVNKTVSKPTQTVASATRSPKANAKTVRLTSSQVAIAKKLGVPLEEYAKQLMNTKEV